MNTGGEVADMMVKEGIQITEAAAKLTASGAKNLAAILLAMSKDSNKLKGKTNLKRLLKSDKPLCVVQIKDSDLKKFNDEAKRYGVLFTAVRDKKNGNGLCEIVSKQDDAAVLNYIMEKLNYPLPEKSGGEEQPKKESPPRTESQSRRKSAERGDIKRQVEIKRPSVIQKINEIKEKSKTNKAVGKVIKKIKKRGKSKELL